MQKELLLTEADAKNIIAVLDIAVKAQGLGGNVAEFCVVMSKRLNGLFAQPEVVVVETPKEEPKEGEV